ncbi:MAG TPA: hypothetical protein VFV55_03155 [Usitatibacteraceae bacterium]|nr:hypothetical protein [Usitatibacteraceae bacterium]
MHLESALPIVKALADGVNPVTGESYPEGSPYAEPRALRALFSAVDLMQREVEREKRRERLPANFGKPWSEGEDHAVTAAFDAGLTIPEVARKHARTQGSIRLRLEKLGKLPPSGEARYDNGPSAA